eukprot:scaffold212118_cov46-Prasinocladus_malaysianus.AAC.1
MAGMATKRMPSEAGMCATETGQQTSRMTDIVQTATNISPGELVARSCIRRQLSWVTWYLMWANSAQVRFIRLSRECWVVDSLLR